MPEFSDEFNGTSLDETKWDTVYRNWTGRDPGIFDSSNVSVADGYLRLDVNLPPAGTLPAGKQYTTSGINTTGGDPGTRPEKSFTGISKSVPESMDAKTTASFYLFNNNPQQWTEIDVMELSANRPRSMPTNLHDIRENGQPVVPGGSLQFPAILNFDAANVPAGETHSNSFHTYGLDWNAETINWYIDGTLVRSMANEHWHQPLWLNLTNSIQDFNGVPTAAALAAAHPFLVDYIRVYQSVPTSNAAPQAGSSV